MGSAQSACSIGFAAASLRAPQRGVTASGGGLLRRTGKGATRWSPRDLARDRGKTCCAPWTSTGSGLSTTSPSICSPEGIVISLYHTSDSAQLQGSDHRGLDQRFPVPLFAESNTDFVSGM